MMSEQQKRAEERRKCTRVQLDRPLFAVMRISEENRFRVMIADISFEGAQLLLPPGQNPAEVPDNAPLFLFDFPPQFSQLDGIEARLAWRGPANCGVIFKNTISLSLNQLTCLNRG
jgi:hypothetical protein